MDSRAIIDIDVCFQQFSNILFYRVATGYGQPPSTLYDWTLCSAESMDANFKLSGVTKARLEIEKFCDKVNKTLYSSRRDPVGLCSDTERSTLISFLARDFDELEEKLKSENDGNPSFQFYLLCMVEDSN